MKNLVRFSYLLFLFPIVYARENSYLQGIFETIGPDVFNYILAFILPTFIVYFALSNSGILKGSTGDAKGVAGISGSIGLITAFYVISTGFDFMSFVMGWFWIVFAFALVLVGYNIFKSFSGINPKENIASGALFLSIISLSFAFIFEGMVEKTSCSTGFGMNLVSSWFDFCNGALVNDALTIGTISGAVAVVSFFSNIPKDSTGSGLGSRIIEGLVSGRRTIPNSDKDDPSMLPPYAGQETYFISNYINDFPPSATNRNNLDTFKSNLWNKYARAGNLELRPPGAGMDARIRSYDSGTMAEATRASIAQDLQTRIIKLITDIEATIKSCESDLKNIKKDKTKYQKIIKRFESNNDSAVMTEVSNYRKLLTKCDNSIKLTNDLIQLSKDDINWLNTYMVKYTDLSSPTKICADFENKFRLFKAIANFNGSRFSKITPVQVAERKELHAALDAMTI